MKYQSVDLANPVELAAIAAGDKIRINDWRNGMTVVHRTENHILLKGNDFGQEIISVIELLPAKYTRNNLEAGHFTAGGDFWLCGWSGWYVDEPFKVVMNERTMEAYLRSFETGETEFSRHAVTVKRMEIKRPPASRAGRSC